MKKLYLMAGLAALFLTGCGLLSGEQTDASSSSDTALASSDEPASADTSGEVVSKTLVGDVENVHHRDTITYQGKRMLHLRMELVADLPADAAEKAANLSPEEITNRIRSAMEQDAQYQELQSINGFSLDYSVTEDKRLQTTIEIDFQQVTPENLQKISDMKELGLQDIRDVTPEIFIVGMKLNGLREEGQEESQ